MKIKDIKTPEQLLSWVKSKGHIVFDGPEKWDMNIIGVRSLGGSTNTFNDKMFIVARNESGALQMWSWDITTDPGTFWLTTPGNSMGTACLVPAQYRGAYRYGLHKGKPALVQVKNVKVFRDNDRSTQHDMDPRTITEGVYGINIHRAGTDSKNVDNWSAGCQVFKRNKDFEEFLAICTMQSRIHKGWDLYTYTLMIEE